MAITSGLPSGLINSVVDGTPHFALPGFKTRGHSTSHPTKPTPRSPIRSGTPTSPVSRTDIHGSGPTTSPAPGGISSKSGGREIAFSASPLRTRVLRHHILRLGLGNNPEESTGIDHIVRSTLHSHVGNKRLSLSILSGPGQSVDTAHCDHATLIPCRICGSLVAKLIDTHTTRPRVLPSGLATDTCVETYVLTLRG